MKGGFDFLKGNFMDYIKMPVSNEQPMNRKRMEKQTVRNDNFGFRGDIGLDLGNVMNMGINRNFEGNSDLWRGGRQHQDWGFENYIARDFAAPKAFSRYGKEAKGDKKYRTVGPDDEVLYGLESLAISAGRGIDNSRKAGKLIGKRIYEKNIRAAKKSMDKQRSTKYYKDTMRYESEPREEKDNTAEAYGGMDDSDRYDDYETVEPMQGGYSRGNIDADLSEQTGYGNYGQSGIMLVRPRKGKKGRKYTKFLGRKDGRNYFGSQVYEGYFPE